MKTVIKNILEHLGEKGMGVIIQMDNCKVCLNNKNVKSYIYSEDIITDQFLSFQIKYTDLIIDKWFTHALAVYINNFAPRSKRTRPKIMWPEGQLLYSSLEDIEWDMQALFGSSIQDGTATEYLQKFYEKNLLPNVK